MCGIVGLIEQSTADASGAAAMAKLRHRGPDGESTQLLKCKGKEIWFGHTRLAILDVSEAGRQPMASRDGRWWITFNGEIYNHPELRHALQGPWRGHSDTETLVEALAAWGIQATLQRLNGMFAFVAVDLEAGRAYLVRDPFGIKPLYYSCAGDGLGFASEIRALAALTTARYSLDTAALQTFLSLRFVPAPQTLLDGILRVRAGHCVTVDIAMGGHEERRYVGDDSARFTGSVSEAVDHYHALLQQAVQRQMLSDVPVGVLLSGGVDSAAIAALAAEQNGKTPCISVGFGADFPECELADAADTAQLLGLPFHPVLVSQDQLWETFEDCISSIEEPLGTSSVLPMWHLCRRARELVTVVLTGQGSDEPWGGYRRYQAELWRDIPFMPVLAQSMAPVLPHLPEHLERALSGIPVSDRATRFEKEYCLFTPSQRHRLTGRADYGAAVATIGYWLDATSGAVAVRGAEAMMKVDSRMGLADDLLLYGDKVSMAHSLEARVPMLDLELVRFIESLPLHYRVSLKGGKIVHKRTAEKYLPASIVHRRKRGFGVPFAVWIRSCWRERAAEVLFDPSGLHLNWLRQDGIRELWDAHQSGRRNYARQIFALLAFAFWCRTMAGCLAGTGSHRQPISMKAYDAYLV